MPRRGGFRGTSLDRTPFAAPFLPAAVQHRCIVEAEDAQHPPDSRCPPGIGGAVKHDPRALADAKTAHRCGKCLGRGQHEAEAMVLVREIALQIDELRAGDMGFFEIGPARDDLVSNLRVGNKMRRTVENSEIGVPELAFQRLGLDQEFGMGKSFACAHAALTSVDAASDGTSSYSAAWASRVGRKFFGSPALAIAPCWTTFGNKLWTSSRTASSRSRSIPVSNPITSSMKARSSVTMLPVAPGAYGQPPSPPNEASKARAPALRAASTLARPSPRVSWKCPPTGNGATSAMTRRKTRSTAAGWP